MNLVKKLIATALVALMAVSVTACHPKNETAVTVDGVKFTSAYYMCALLYADTSARSKVQESLTDDEKNSSDIDYYSHKVEDTDYVKWVKAEALNSLKNIAAYKLKCKEAKLELEEDVKTNAKQYASYYWSSYGYSQMFEPNGVNEDTYTQYMLDSYYSNLYFEHVYGKDGEKAIAADEVTAKIAANYVLVDQLEASFSNQDETAIAALKEKFNGYLTALQNGSMTFEQVYKDYNGSTGEESDTTEDTDEVQPLDKYATVLGGADTTNPSAQYDTAVAMANGEIKLIEEDDNAGIMILIKRDLSADQYYMDNLDLSARHLIKDEEFEADMEKYAKELDCKTSNYAINQFKVKKIVYPETSAS